MFALSDTLEVTMPIERSFNAVTRTSWEKVGVEPDVDCDAGRALDVVLERIVHPGG